MVSSSCTSSCGGITVDAHYRSITGDKDLPTQTKPHASRQTFSFTIPGGDVYWWNTSTNAPYVFGYWFDVSQSQGGDVTGGGLSSGSPTVTTRAPLAPGTIYEREVVIRLRLRYAYPDGVDAAGITVLSGGWTSQGTSRFRISTTDETGRVILDIEPAADPILADHAASQGYGFFSVEVYDWVPLNDDTPQTRVVNTNHILTSLNMGNGGFQPIDRTIQDRTLVLQPQTVQYHSEQDSPPDCTVLGTEWSGSEACRQVLAQRLEDEPVAYNVGGDAGVTTRFRYQNSVSTIKGWFVKGEATAKYGQGEGRVNNEKSDSQDFGFSVNVAGNGTDGGPNQKVIVKPVWYEVHEWFGFYSVSGRTVLWEQYRYIPHEWLGHKTYSNRTNYHGLARAPGWNQTGPDCTIMMGSEEWTTTAQGTEHGWQVSLGLGNVISVGYNQLFQSTLTVGYKWEQPGGLLDPNHSYWLSVYNGCPTLDENGNPKCHYPKDAPDLAWTTQAPPGVNWNTLCVYSQGG